MPEINEDIDVPTPPKITILPNRFASAEECNNRIFNIVSALKNN